MIPGCLDDDIGRRNDQDIVVDCAGTTDGLELGMRLVRTRGRIALKSLPPVEDSLGRRGAADLAPLGSGEIGLVGSFFGPLPQGFDLLAGGQVEVINLISRRMKLEDGSAIFAEAAAREAIAVLVQV